MSQRLPLVQLLALIPFLAIAAALLLPASIAQTQEEETTEEENSSDAEQIRRAIFDFVEKYNDHKADEVAALFATDARMVFRDGTEVNGQEEIEQVFADEFRNRPDTAISVVVDAIRFLTPEVAVEEGVTSLFPDGETLTSQGRYTVLHLKKDGRWQMQSVRVVNEETLSAYGELQPLEWLVGDWVDEGRSEVVEAQFQWNDNKSFLLEDFQVVRNGEIVLKGTQRIGWDPEAKQIRSWIFDSAGGFGEATWTPVNDTWVCKAKGMAADGTRASATRTLTRTGEDRVVWSATDRMSGGEQLPNLDVTMVRKPPMPE